MDKHKHLTMWQTIKSDSVQMCRKRTGWCTIKNS